VFHGDTVIKKKEFSKNEKHVEGRLRKHYKEASGLGTGGDAMGEKRLNTVLFSPWWNTLL